MHSAVERVLGSVFSLWAGVCPSVWGRSDQAGKRGKRGGAGGGGIACPSLALRPGCRGPSCSLPKPKPNHSVPPLGTLGRPYFLNHDACRHVPHCLQKHH